MNDKQMRYLQDAVEPEWIPFHSNRTYGLIILAHTSEPEKTDPPPDEFNKRYRWHSIGYNDTNNKIKQLDHAIQTMKRRPWSLSRVHIHTMDTNKLWVSYHYLVTPSEYRMMQLLAEPPVPKDILRHIYNFVGRI
jgi:hypothetical protein